ncbi:MAG: site-specific integrase [Ruminococcaceae bacterium]|nr:site-specific integrase [Oscillospiraceae bacterium]
MATKDGNRWRTAVLISAPGEPRKYKSFYGATAKEADYLAMRYKMEGKKTEAEKRASMTLGEAVEAYIELRTPTLSPSTIQGYEVAKRNYIGKELAGKLIKNIDYVTLQREANRISENHSVKTAKNTIGLVCAVLRVYNPDFVTRQISYPKTVKKEYTTPDAETLVRTFKAIEGTVCELPVLLSAWLSLRMSEILGLKWTDIRDGYIDINTAIVMGNYGPVEKTTKTEGSTRKIPLPQFLKDRMLALPRKGDHIFEGLSSSSIAKSFHRALNKHDIPHYRFHDLRHANASIMLMLGVPDKYAMERGGWSSPSVMKSVYQQTFSSEQIAIAERIDNYFLDLMQRSMQRMNP